MNNDISPLYQNLRSNSGDVSDDLTSEQKDEFVKRVKLLDENGHEIIYILIRMYENDTTSKFAELPYGSKSTSKELKFDLDNLPNQLKWMIYKFSKLHLDKMSEENTRKKLGM